MPQTITTGYKALVEAAEREIETVSIEDALKLHGRGDTVLVDLRDPRELEREGKIPGAFHCPRGMLEFWIDPESPYHKPQFAEDKRFVFASHGTEAGGAYRRRLRRLEEGRRAGGGMGAQAKERAKERAKGLIQKAVWCRRVRP
jgi:rhodanese-related sulfurtransferase